jgi:putative spermidine/putrescine transport system permease protein
VGMIGLMNKGFTLEYWQKMFLATDAPESFAYSFFITFLSLVMILGFSLAFSWWQVRRPRKWFNNLLFLPLTFPPLVAAFSWFYILSPGGLISRFFIQTGIISGVEDFPRLVNDTLGIGILSTHVFLVFPLFGILFLHQANKERIPDLMQVSQTLGSDSGHFFTKVYVPLILKKTAPFIILYTVFLFGAFEVPLLLGKSAPRMITIFITEKMSKFNLMDIPVAQAAAVVYSFLVISMTAILIRKNTLEI